MTTETSNARGLVAKWRTEAAALDEKAAEREPDGRLVWAEWMRDRMSVEASTKRGDANELEAALNATPPPPADAEVRARELLAKELPEWLASDVRAGNIRYQWVADAIRAIVAALSQKPEARGVVDEAMVERAREAYFNAAEVKDGVFTDPVAMRAALTAALTETRNVR